MPLTPKQLTLLRAARVGGRHLGNRLQLAIDLADETQASVAKALELPYTYVSDTARARYQTITVENARKFAAHFGCQIEDLFPARERVAS